MFKKKKIENNKKILSFFTILFIFIVSLLAIITINFLINNENSLFIKNNNSEKFSLNGKGENIIKEKKEIKGDKINILLLGRGGSLNDAPDLTDTIILASINKKNKTISMLSIPRDLYVEYKEGKGGKINKIYLLSKLKGIQNRDAINILKDKISEITNEKIDYYINADFKGFSAFIDAIGGVKITVDKTLIDPKFPDSNWGYRKLIIKKGTWLFDGDVALMYARSRHSTSDFDRGLRQQQILKAIKDKLNEGGFFSKAFKIKKFYNVFKKYVETDLGIIDMLDVLNEVGMDNDYKILSFNLNDSCFYGDPNCSSGGFLYVPQRKLYGGASVLLPNNAYLGNISEYSEIKQYTDLIFNNSNIYKENTEIKIYNSTKVRGIAGDLATFLTRYGLNIPENNSIGNIRNKIYLKSIIYCDKNVYDSELVKFIKKVTGIKEIKDIDILEDNNDSEIGIKIILGNDYKIIFENLKNNLSKG